MASRRVGGGNVGTKRGQPFTFHSVTTSFYSIILEVRRKILLLERKEARDIPYHLDSKLADDVKWVLDPHKFLKRKLNLLNSLALHQKMATLLCFIF